MQFSALYKQYWREYQGKISVSALKNCEIAGWQKSWAIYILCKFEFLEKNFSETIWCIGLKFSEIIETVMPFQYSEFLFY